MFFKLPHFEDDCGGDKDLLNTLSTPSNNDDDSVDGEDQKHAGLLWQSTCDSEVKLFL